MLQRWESDSSDAELENFTKEQLEFMHCGDLFYPFVKTWLQEWKGTFPYGSDCNLHAGMCNSFLFELVVLRPLLSKAVALMHHSQLSACFFSRLARSTWSSTSDLADSL